MEKSNWSRIGSRIGVGLTLMGLAFAGLWAWRYFFTYPDVNIAILGSIIGLLVSFCGVVIASLSWLYNKNLEVQEKVSGLQDTQSEMDDLLKKKGIIKEDLIEA